MLHQVETPEENHDFLELLWWKKGNLNQEPKKYRMEGYALGAACPPSWASFTLHKTAKNNMPLLAPNLCETVLNLNFYINNCLVSTPSESHAINGYKAGVRK